MGSVGLLYVGAVLFVNGLLLLGVVDGRAAAPINLFVGGLQVVTPTYLIIAADGDARAISLAAGLYLFGFTYLWVGVNALTGWPQAGLGWFSLFVALCAVGFAVHSVVGLGDRTFGAIWLFWSFLWLLFFLVLGLGIDRLARFTGWVTLVEAFGTAAVPGFLLITGVWTDSTALALSYLAVGVLLFGGLWLAAGRRPTSSSSPHPA
ncbi:AmiS/UreI family transporter [Pseudonocardia kunmingensis]|uniref:AmiS/UreI family transporter n=1 Tax=Pseudonocardia kunmingensis TaxID=630975 RepID=A0A543DK02_9PSEU|nr:AmiS/UreI family transporter [Pseudonocardia kunmingensis]TQM09649.1 AmiS/UreI family transporter [Pseudonocardia kunmingensis]